MQSKPWTLREYGRKTVWDWMELLIVPLALAVIGFVFTWQQDVRQQAIEDRRAAREQRLEDQRAQLEQELEDQRAESQRELEEHRAQDEALQAYLDQMNSLLLEKDLRESAEDSEVRTLARARTLTVLGRLDPSQRTQAVRFLVEAELVQRVDGKHPVIALNGANLRGISGPMSGGWPAGTFDLSGAILEHADLRNASLAVDDLSGADLSSAHLNSADLGYADLSDVDFRFADLTEADLSSANLNNADMYHVDLTNADLRYADLTSADLTGEPQLSGADMSEADLSEINLPDATDLSGVNLSEADLSEANLSGGYGVTNEELEQKAKSLEGATMPNGQKYEDWLKDKEGHGEEGENGGPS